MNALQDYFTSVLNMSITASYVAVGVILLRMLLRRTPKIFSYTLWIAVLFRLLCPVSFTSVFSFLGLINPRLSAGAAEYIPRELGFMKSPAVHSGIGAIDSAVNASLPQATPAASVNPMQVWIALLSVIWLTGILLLIIYSAISYIKIKMRLKTATRIRENLYESDRIGTAFVCGFVRPKIYIPVGVRDSDLSYILAHEQTHIKRRDYLIKPIAFFALVIHWFNPLIWISFVLMSRDMEMSCDESVLKKTGSVEKCGYSASLLSLSIKKRGLLTAGPLAFGESDVKVRVKNVLRYKKPTLRLALIVTAVSILMLAVFAADPPNEQAVPVIYSGYHVTALMDNKTPYVGDNSKVAALVDAVPWPEGMTRGVIELHTSAEPYGITVHLTVHGSAGQEAQDSSMLYCNSIVLFSLINNVDEITCEVTGQDDNISGLSYTRDAAEKLLKGDVRLYADSAQHLESLIDQLKSMQFGDNTPEPMAQDSQIETGLAVHHVISERILKSAGLYRCASDRVQRYSRFGRKGAALSVFGIRKRGTDRTKRNYHGKIVPGDTGRRGYQICRQKSAGLVRYL